jgi:hypothetical protein
MDFLASEEREAERRQMEEQFSSLWQARKGAHGDQCGIFRHPRRAARQPAFVRARS